MAEFVILGANNFITRFLVICALFFVAFLMLEVLTGRPKPLNRFWFGIVYLLMAVSLATLPSIFLTIATEDVDMAAIVWLGVAAIFMILLAYAARRRAVDAYGDTRNALLAVIPLICLILIFKKPEDRSRIDHRTTTALAGRIVGFTVGAAAVIFLGSFVKVVFDGMNQNAVVNVASLPITRAIRVQAAILNANTPQYVDEETTLMSASAVGYELLLEYYLIGTSAELTTEFFEPLMRPIVQRNVCSNPIFRDLLDRGASIVFKYKAISITQPLQHHRLQTLAADCR